MSRARRVWKWVAAAVAILLVVAGVAVGALRIWLEQSTTLAPGVVAKLERATGLRLEFSRIDARLGLYGPEFVFRDAKLLAPGETQPLATASAGRVGADWWRMLRTGRLAAGRVTLDGARLHLLITPKGVELLHQGPLWRDETAVLRLDRLPVGRVQIEDAIVVVEDRRTRAAPVQLDRVELELERYSRSLTVTGAARLPRALGASLAFSGQLDGDLAAPPTLDWRGTATLRDAAVAGWIAFAPGVAFLPTAGRGDLRVALQGHGPSLASANAQFDLADVRLPGAGAEAAVYERAAGDVRLEHAAGTWRVGGRNLAFATGGERWKSGEFDAEVEARDGALVRARLRAPDLPLAVLTPLAALLPAGDARDAALALAPRGRLTSVDATLARGAGVREWRVDGGGRFAGLGIGAWHRIPGFAGVDGEFRGTGTSGTLQVRSKGLDFDLPEYLRARVQARELSARFGWEWRPDGWRVAVDDLRAVAPDGRGGGIARLFVPNDESSPRLVIDVTVADLDLAGARKYLPMRRFPPGVVDWLDKALLAGKVDDVRLTYAGEMRRFPFRDGGGEFRVVAKLEGARIHYQDGWADLEDAYGVATFLNAGLSARLERGRVNGLQLAGATVELPEYHDAELRIVANGRGDLRDALVLVQRAPIGPRLGGYFMGLAGRGPLTATVKLDLPLKRFAERVVDVEARVERATAKVPGVDDDVRDLEGTLRLRNRDVDVPSVTGTLLGGPFRASARTADGARGERVLTVQASGRATGAKVQPLLAITRGAWLDGTFDWTLSARLPRLEWRPDPLPLPPDAAPEQQPVPRETEVRWLPMQVRVDSTLAGLAVRLPAPLAKPADDARAFRGEATIDPGVDPADPPPPRALRGREPPRPTTLLVRAQAGRESAVLAWRRLAPPQPAWAFDRATLRFGASGAALRDAPGLWVEGRVADFDLGRWLDVRFAPDAPAVPSGPTAGTPAPAPAATAPGGLANLLRGGAINADRFTYLGYVFPSLAIQLQATDRAWRAQVDGPAARGTVVVPFDLQRAPLVLDLDRVVLGESAPGAGDAPSAPTDPRTLPAMQLDVRSVEVQKRRFGALKAQIAKTPDGLRLESGTLKGASFEATATGTWLAGAKGIQTTLSVDAKSSDLADTLTAFGYAPALSAKSVQAAAALSWPGGIDGNVLARVNGTARVAVQDGQLLTVQPGAGRVLGLMSLSALPRRLALDFTDLTDKGFAFDTITGDFEFRDGNAHTQNLLLKSPAAEIGIVGRTGLAARDYDQTAVITGHLGGPVAAAGALAAGPAIGAALIVFSKVFKEQLSGLARGYYRITGSWDKPKVERIGAGEAREQEPAKVGAATPPG